MSNYGIASVLGVVGFGITYPANDTRLRCQLAIKECLPGSHRPSYDLARDSFLAFFAARFSFMVLAGSFRVCFLLSIPLLIFFAPQ